MHKLFIWIVFVITLASFSFAYQVSVPGSVITVDACGVVSVPITIHNTGVTVIKPTLSVVGRLHTWVDFIDDNQMIAPQESLVVTAFINAPCQQEGEYPLVIRIEDQHIRELEVLLRVRQPDVMAFGVPSNVIQTCPCTSNRIAYELHNTGFFTETYTLSTQYSDVYTIIPSQVTLMPNQRISGFVDVVSACDVYGRFDSPLRITAQKSGVVQEVLMRTTVDECYDFTVNVTQPDIVCNRDVSSIGLHIFNEAHINNGYSVHVRNAPRWVQVYETPVYADASSQVDAFIDLIPIDVLGNVSFDVYVTSQLGTLQSHLPVSLTVEQCHDIVMDIPTQSCIDDTLIPVTITNNGLYNQSISLLTTHQHIVFEQDVVDVQAQHSEVVYLNVTNVSLGNHRVAYRIAHKDNPLVFYEQRITHSHVDVEQCYAFDVGDFIFSDDVVQLPLIYQGGKPGDFSFAFSDGALTLTQNQSLFSFVPGQELVLDVLLLGDTYKDTLLITHERVTLEYRVGETQRSMIFWFIIIFVILLLVVLVLLILFFTKGTTQTHDSLDTQNVDNTSAKKNLKENKQKNNSTSTQKDDTILSLFFIILFVIIALALIGFVVYLYHQSVSTQDGVLVDDNQTYVGEYIVVGTEGNQSNENSMYNQTHIDNQTRNESFVDDDVVGVHETTTGDVFDTQDGDVCNWWCRFIAFLRGDVVDTQDMQQDNVTYNQSESDVVNVSGIVDDADSGLTESQVDSDVGEDIYQDIRDDVSEDNSAYINDSIYVDDDVLTEQLAEQDEHAYIESCNLWCRLVGFFTREDAQQEQHNTTVVSSYTIDLLTIFNESYVNATFVHLAVEHFIVIIQNSTVYVEPKDDFAGQENITFIARLPNGQLVRSEPVTLQASVVDVKQSNETQQQATVQGSEQMNVTDSLAEQEGCDCPHQQFAWLFLIALLIMVIAIWYVSRPTK
ncbi:MAG: hypothetical protein ACMXYC_02560 [Candidatus Woesearchaeota archaeon]